jgi:hypothetical protein
VLLSKMYQESPWCLFALLCGHLRRVHFIKNISAMEWLFIMRYGNLIKFPKLAESPRRSFLESGEYTRYAKKVCYTSKRGRKNN